MKSLLLILLCLAAVVTRGSTNAVGFRTDLGSYVATSVRDLTLAGESEQEIQEYWFDGESSWRVVCVECTSDYSSDIVIVGRKAWELRDGAWVRGDFDSLKFPTLGVHALLATEFDDVERIDGGDWSEGPIIHGEPTLILAVDLGDYGEMLTSGLDDKELAAAIREDFRGSTARSRFVIGTETKRIYEFEFNVEGPKFEQRSATTVVYGVELEISEPD